MIIAEDTVVKHIDYAKLLSFRSGGTILGMNHLTRDIEHHSTKHLTILNGLIKLDILRESAMQEFYFLKRMHWHHAILGMKIISKNIPEGSIAIRAFYSHSSLLGTNDATTPNALPTHIA